MLTAEIYVNLPIKSIAQAYTYRVPEELAQVGVGWRVLVPFGGKKIEGFVLVLKEQTAEELARRGIKELKDISAAVDEEAWFSPVMLEEARWLADFYLCSLAEAMRLFMPGKSGLSIKVEYLANEEKAATLPEGTDLRALYDYILAHGPVPRPVLLRALPALKEKLPALLGKLLSRQLISKYYTATKRDKARYERYLVLQKPLTEADRAAFARKKAQLKLWAYLEEQGGTASLPAIKEAGHTSETAKKLVAVGIATWRKRRVLRDSYADATASAVSANDSTAPQAACCTGAPAHEPRHLTPEQAAAVAAVRPFLAKGEPHGFLLFGVTSSGKTQVYIELARLTRAQGRKVIVLVPEIALTGQLVLAFKAYFAEDIIVVHSRLSLAERNDAAHRARRGEAGVIIGARSALFTPTDDVGLIILDEEQDMSYKQDEAPRYHARAVAEAFAQKQKAVLLLGSATPSLETYHRAQTGDLALLPMPRRIGDMPLPEVTSVDMRQELKMGNRHIISRPLEALLRQTLAAGEQSIIMLNRRGYSTFVMCRACGEAIKCPDCGLPLTYHQRRGESGTLLCHHCDLHAPVPTVCPKCGSRYIKYFGSGTEKLEEELKTLLPEARVIRMDRDTTGAKFAHQAILERFRRGDFDILLGTQMVAKGHDIAGVTAVGIISADASLNRPDFRAAEQTFMLITQAAGRAGRHPEAGTGQRGHVLVQAYEPVHYAVTCGLAQDYAGFYREEIGRRRALGYPPFTRLVKLTFQGQDESATRANAEELAQKFRARFPEDAPAAPLASPLLGPAPALIARFRGIYRFVVLIKAGNLPAVQAFLRQEGLHLRPDVLIDIDPLSTL